MSDLSAIKVFGIDVDGTLTDGIYQVSDQGGISKGFNTRDFYAMGKLVKAGIQVVIVTGATDNVIDTKLATTAAQGIQLIKGVKNKYQTMSIWLEVSKMDFSNLAFIGDAENDYKIMEAAAWSACPADAVQEVLDISHYSSIYGGGKAAVHDCIRKFYEKTNRMWEPEFEAHFVRGIS